MTTKNKEHEPRTGSVAITLDDVTDSLLHDDNAAMWLHLADNYIQLYNDNPGNFILPAAHAHLRPIIATYAHSLPLFVRYILGIRDSFINDDEKWKELQKLYRTVNTRALQRSRRERINRAVEKAIEAAGGTVTYEERMLYARKLEQDWGKRRLRYMDNQRKLTKDRRLSTTERADVLDDFWAMIDNEIEAGKLPPIGEKK